MRLIRVFAVLAVLACWERPVALAQPPQAAQEEFVPLSEVPPEEQMPAAPMVVAAYAFVWVALLTYLWTLARRIRRVDADLKNLERGAR